MSMAPWWCGIICVTKSWSGSPSCGAALMPWCMRVIVSDIRSLKLRAVEATKGSVAAAEPPSAIPRTSRLTRRMRPPWWRYYHREPAGVGTVVDRGLGRVCCAVAEDGARNGSDGPGRDRADGPRDRRRPPGAGEDRLGSDGGGVRLQPGGARRHPVHRTQAGRLLHLQPLALTLAGIPPVRGGPLEEAVVPLQHGHRLVELGQRRGGHRVGVHHRRPDDRPHPPHLARVRLVLRALVVP